MVISKAPVEVIRIIVYSLRRVVNRVETPSSQLKKKAIDERIGIRA